MHPWLQDHLALTDVHNIANPFAGKVIAYDYRLALGHPHDPGEIMCLVAFDDDRTCAIYGAINEKTRC